MSKDGNFEAHLENIQPNYLHLLLALPLGIIMLVLRLIFQRYLFKPAAKYYGMKVELLNALQHNMLDNVYGGGVIDNKMLAKLSKKLQMSKKEVREWLKHRFSQEELPQLRNFFESSWKCFYASCSFTCGISIFWNKPWLWDIKECFYNHPFHVVTNDMWWYYMVSIAYYWSRIAIHYCSKNTNNFMEFFFHNIVLLAYLHLSWYANLVRLGILIIFLMVFADIIVERIKMLHFTFYHICWDFVNVILVLMWFLSRNYIFPIYIVYGSIAAGFELIQITPTIIIIYILLVTINIMDAAWIVYHLSLSN